MGLSARNRARGYYVSRRARKGPVSARESSGDLKNPRIQDKVSRCRSIVTPPCTVKLETASSSIFGAAVPLSILIVRMSFSAPVPPKVLFEAPVRLFRTGQVVIVLKSNVPLLVRFPLTAICAKSHFPIRWRNCHWNRS